MLLERLINTEEDGLPKALRAELLAAGPAVVPELIALIEADLAGELDSWASVHAAELLGEIEDARAVPVLIRCLSEADGLTYLHENASQSLKQLGQLALDPCLAAYARCDDDDLRDSLAIVLSRLKVQDERIFNILLDTLARDSTIGANALFDYGNVRALPHLSDTFDTAELDQSDALLANQDLIELRAAIEDFGGRLTLAQIEKYERAMLIRERTLDRFRGGLNAVASPPPNRQPLTRSRPKLGRNEPCWCGSGKKYKRCHLLSD